MKEAQTVQKDARLHEKAVQAVARGEVAPTPRPRRRGPQKASGAVSHVRVLPAVWAKAQTLLLDPTNHYSRVEIVSANEVIVR